MFFIIAFPGFFFYISGKRIYLILKAVLLMLTGLAILWRRCTDDRLPWTALWVLASVFISRVYWLTAWGTLRAEQLACLALFLHYLIDLLRKRQWPRFGVLPLLLLAMLPLMLLGSWLNSPFPAASLRKTLIYFPYLAGFAALCHFLDDREKLNAAWDFLTLFGTGMMAVSLAGYLLFFAGIDLGMVRIEFGVIWLRGSLANPNIFGAAAGLVLISVLARFITSNQFPGRRSFFDLGALVIASAALVVSFSRAAWVLAMLAAAAVFLYARRERKNWFPALSALLLSVLIISMIASSGSKAFNAKLELNPEIRPASAGEFGEPAQDRFVNAPYNALAPTAAPFQRRLQYDFSSLRWRFVTSWRALRDWQKNPVMGRGTDSLMLSHPGIPQYYLPVTWVAILHDWGIVALALYIAFLLLAGSHLGKRLFLPSAPSGLALAIFLVFFFQTLQSQVTTTLSLASFWVLAAVFAAAAERLPGRPEKTGGPDDRPGWG